MYSSLSQPEDKRRKIYPKRILEWPKESQSVVAEDLSFLACGNAVTAQDFAHGIAAPLVVGKVRGEQDLILTKERHLLNQHGIIRLRGDENTARFKMVVNVLLNALAALCAPLSAA
jgi:hypothetical protein